MKNLFVPFLLLFAVVFVGCDDDVPEAEDAPELITKVQLLFSPKSGGSPIVVEAIDDDGIGPNDLEPSSAIVLAAGEEYELFLDLENTLNNESITEEVEEESDEHMFFFAFTEGLFSSPAGSGNMTDRSAQVNYIDEDANGLPIGLITSWVAAEAGSTGSFRVVLKHQPDIKSETSTANDGETDVDITWSITVE